MNEEATHKLICQYLKARYPNVLFNTDLSGIKLTMGQAVKVKALRSCKGFPDIVIYEPRNGYHGLFIELKREGEKIYKKDGTPVSEHVKEQLEVIEKLLWLGYQACICVGFEEAKNVINKYLKL